MAASTCHILLIEDNADDRAEMRQLLLRGGSRRYRFSEARLGADGVRLVQASSSGPVDCVLLDYDLPDMNAHGVLAALCGPSGLAPCPVVVITGAATEEGLQLLTAGAQDYIGKRWTNAESLTRAVENAIERFALLTAQRQAEDAWRLSDERYRVLFNSIDAGYAVIQMLFNANGEAIDARYMQVNPAFERQTGLHNAVGQTVRGLIPNIELKWLESYGAVALSGVPVRLEQHSDALHRWFDVQAFRLGEPQARQVAVLFNDITERKQAEIALLAASAEALRANRAKSDFLLSMSHELRSPLNAMLGFAQLIEASTPAPTASQRYSVEQILHAGWYLLGLINEILDLTSIESGALALTSQPVSLQAVLEDCHAMIEPQAQAAGIAIFFPQFEEAIWVQGDPIRIKQVMVNLLSNAIKYNRSNGRVDVRLAIAGAGVRISVEDTGLGLREAEVAQLFEPFNRLGKPTGSAAGTGIGLVISKRLVELMEGRIGVESTPGSGSCFWFELKSPTLAPTIPSLPVHTVLCVEPDAARLLALEQRLACWPRACVLRARDVPDAIQIARAARPDVILFGVQRSDSSGEAAIRVLALDPITVSIPVIAVAVDATPGDILSGLAAGFCSFHSATVGTGEFVDALEFALRQTPLGAPQLSAVKAG